MIYVWSGSRISKLTKVLAPVFREGHVPWVHVPVLNTLFKLSEGMALKGTVILATGQKALTLLQQSGLVNKGRAITSLRGIPIKIFGGKVKVLISYDTGIVDVDSMRLPEVIWDAKLAVRLHHTGSLNPVVGNYKYVSDYTYEIEYIKDSYEKTGNLVDIAVDLETVGLDPFAQGVFIVSISVTVKSGQASVIRFGKGKKADKKLIHQVMFLTSDPRVKVKGANFKFDMLWMMVHWDIDRFDSFTFDTALVGSLLDENRSNSLNMHAKIYTEMGGYDSDFNRNVDKSRMDLVSDEDLLPYAGGDTDACVRVAYEQKKELVVQDRLTNFYVNLVLPVSKAVLVMEHRGMIVDTDRYSQVRVDVVKEIDRVSSEALKMIPRKLQLKYNDNLSLTRDTLLREFLFTKKGLNLQPEMETKKNKEPSCAMEHFELLLVKYPKREELHKFVELMRGFNSAKKTLDTYITGFLRHLRSDGRFHPTYMLHRGEYGGKEAGTITGRSSAKDPAYQTIPSHTIWAKLLRSVYVPPKGMVILNADFSQGELRITACLANEDTMIKAYKRGMDLHAITAGQLLNMGYEEFMSHDEDWIYENRSSGKAGNFGLIYGMGQNGFRVYARKAYGLILSQREVANFVDGFFDLYSALHPWHDESIDYARRHKCVVSPLGRIRHLPLINSYNSEVKAKQERQSINSPVQATLSDMTFLAISILYKQYPELWVFGMTHDSIGCYVSEDNIDVWAKRIKDVMENLPLKEKFGWDPQLHFDVDVEVGVNNLGEIEKLKLN